MKRPWIICLLLYFLSSCNNPQADFKSFADANPKFDFHVKNARIMDGTGASAFKADILIRSDTIAYIGEVDSSLIVAEQTIDAQGNIISPGFIDPHAHGDPLKQPDFHNFLAMGVTSICLGQDGYHAPEKDLNTWMEQVDAKSTGVNILPFVGHGTLRELSGIGYSIDPEPEKIASMHALLEDALKKGAWGMSTGLEYRPGFLAKDSELLGLAKIVGDNKRMIMSHVRNEDDDQLEASIRELIRQGQFCKVHISHLKSVYGKGEQRAEEILNLLDSARLENIVITADIYPYTASYTGIGILFPDWALAPNNYQQVKKDRRFQLEGYLKRKVRQRNGPEATLFGTAPYAGKTLKEVAFEKKKAFEKVLVEDIGPSGASAAYFVMDTSLQERLIKYPYVMVSSDGSPTMRHPRGYGSFSKIIESYVQEKKLFSLEEAIYKMSGLTAQTLGLTDRGFVKVGFKADLLLFDPEEVKSQASFESPFELATGIRAVWVNGQLSMENNVFRPQGNGKVLRATSKGE